MHISTIKWLKLILTGQCNIRVHGFLGNRYCKIDEMINAISYTHNVVSR